MDEDLPLKCYRKYKKLAEVERQYQSKSDSRTPLITDRLKGALEAGGTVWDVPS